MLGIRYIKVPPTTWVMQFRDGKIRYEGSGTSFFYFGPRSTIVAVPIASTDVPFMFSESTADFQQVTAQGHLTYRVADPKKLAALLDFSLRPDGKYATEDPSRLSQRIALAAQSAIRAEIQSRALRVALVEADAVARAVRTSLAASPSLQALGIELLGRCRRRPRRSKRKRASACFAKRTTRSTAAATTRWSRSARSARTS